ncbi:hypothetical protein EUGRSUZ_E01283 [Eucalyptus grandis]|uniref:Uncharacterized protein n=2 Tax=Eucalyptus grandis TaxID=71139 RepID=A0ACC3KTU3_EUCGR|nr:hypothetical protein EUGRSUZ_E01283 [Eucalyptus grandis]
MSSSSSEGKHSAIETKSASPNNPIRDSTKTLKAPNLVPISRNPSKRRDSWLERSRRSRGNRNCAIWRRTEDGSPWNELRSMDLRDVKRPRREPRQRGVSRLVMERLVRTVLEMCSNRLQTEETDSRLDLVCAERDGLSSLEYKLQAHEIIPVNLIVCIKDDIHRNLDSI